MSTRLPIEVGNRSTIPFYDLGALHREIAPELNSALARVVASNSLVLGAEVEAFEAEFAAYCGTSYGVGVGNGLDALRLALTALGIGPGDEVVVPGQTFIATWLAVSAVGAVPVPADVSPDTGQINPDCAEAVLSSRTAAVIAVHLFGSMAPVDSLRRLCDRESLALVEDAAQAHGAALDGARAGACSDIAAFSFYPSKNLGALGDGGMVVTSDAGLAERVRLLRNYGSTQKYHHEIRGINSRLDELQAAVLRVKLPLLEEWNSRRRVLADRYRAGLADYEEVQLPPDLVGSVPVHHLFPVLVGDRDDFVERMARLGVDVGIHYPHSPSQTPAYRAHRLPGGLPATEFWSAHEVSLPIGPAMEIGAVDEVVARVLDAYPHR